MPIRILLAAPRTPAIALLAAAVASGALHGQIADRGEVPLGGAVTGVLPARVGSGRSEESWTFVARKDGALTVSISAERDDLWATWSVRLPDRFQQLGVAARGSDGEFKLVKQVVRGQVYRIVITVLGPPATALPYRLRVTDGEPRPRIAVGEIRDWSFADARSIVALGGGSISYRTEWLLEPAASDSLVIRMEVLPPHRGHLVVSRLPPGGGYERLAETGGTAVEARVAVRSGERYAIHTSNLDQGGRPHYTLQVRRVSDTVPPPPDSRPASAGPVVCAPAPWTPGCPPLEVSGAILARLREIARIPGLSARLQGTPAGGGMAVVLARLRDAPYSGVVRLDLAPAAAYLDVADPAPVHPYWRGYALGSLRVWSEEERGAGADPAVEAFRARLVRWFGGEP